MAARIDNNQSITVNPEEDSSFAIRMNSGGEPYDISDAELRFVAHIIDEDGEPDELELIPAINPDHAFGRLLSISAEQARLIGASPCRYFLQQTIDGERRVLMEGRIRAGSTARMEDNTINDEDMEITIDLVEGVEITINAPTESRLIDLRADHEALRDDFDALIQDGATSGADHVWSIDKLKAYVISVRDALVDASPGQLDTLNELAAAINDDANFAATTAAAFAKRVRVDAAQTFTGPEKAQARANIDVYSKDEIDNPTATFNASLTLGTVWQDTPVNGADLATGTYLVEVSISGAPAASGTMVWFSGATDNAEGDEIMLDRCGSTDNPVFLRTITAAGELRLQIAAVANDGAASSITIKAKRLI